MYTQRSLATLAKAKGQKKNGLKMAAVGVIVLSLVCLVLSFVLRGSAEPGPFDAVNGTPAHAYVDIQEMYYFDAIDDQGNRYYIAWDTEDYVWILKQNDDTVIENYSDIMDYSFAVTEVAPDPVRITGVPVEITQSIIDETLQEIVTYYNFLEGDVYDDATFYEYFGAYYLDTTQVPAASTSMPLVIGAIVGLLVGLGLLSVSLVTKGSDKSMQPILARYGNEVGSIDYELNQPTTLAMDDIGVYVTPHYLISTMGGIQIDRNSEVANISSAFSNNKHILNLSTTDGRYRPIAEFRNPMQADGAFNAIKGQLDRVLGSAAQQVQAQAPAIPVQAPISPYVPAAPAPAVPVPNPVPQAPAGYPVQPIPPAVPTSPGFSGQPPFDPTKSE